MAEKELNIKVKADVSELTKYRRAVKDAENEVLLAGKGMGKFAGDTKAAGEALRKAQTNLLSAKATVKEFGVATKMSGAQLLEFGENLTVVTAGFSVVLNKVRELGAELYKTMKEGAGFGVMYEAFEKLSGGSENARLELELFRKAAAGTMNDSELIKYANRMKELGYNTEQTTQLLNLAENKSDELGTTIEEGTDKILRFLETGRGKGLYQLGIDIGEVNKKMTELSGLTEQQIKDLTDESAQRLRTQAVLELYGESLDKIKNKQKDNADTLEAMEKTVQNVELAFGRAFSGRVLGQIDNFGKAIENATGKTYDMDKSSRSLGGYLGDSFGRVLPFLAGGWLGVATNMLSAVLASEKMKPVLESLRSGINGIIDGLKNMSGVLGKAMPSTWASSLAGAVQFAYGKIKDLLKLMNKIPGIEILIPDEVAKKGRNIWAIGGTSEMESEDLEFKEKNTKGGTKGKDKEKVDLIQQLIDGIRERLELAKLEKTISQDMYSIAYEELKTQLANTQAVKDRLKLLKEIETIGKELWFNKKIPFGGITTEDYTPERNLEPRMMQRVVRQSLSEMLFGDKEFATEFIGKINEGMGAVGDTLNNMMTTLGLEKDKFVSGLVSGFDRALQYINLIVSALNAVNTVKSVFSMVTSLAGGIVGGASGGGMVAPMVQRQSPMINVVVQSEIEKTKAVRFFDNYYDSYKSFAKESSF